MIESFPCDSSQRRSLAGFLLAGCLLATARPAGAATLPPLDPARLPPASAATIDFAKDIQPLFESKCLKCHGPGKSKSGFRLDGREQALAGGDNGVDIVPGDSAKSPLSHFVARLVADFQMPPEGKGEPLSPKEIGLIRAWIDQGAKWPASKGQTASSILPADKSDWWSLKPLARPAIPKPSLVRANIRNPIDAFILARLAEKGLRPSPEAGRVQLVRRLYFDLTGLPPAPEEVQAFLQDRDPRAYEKLVDRLLDSPRYGERWARHWLDVVHFGETHGYDKDKPRPNAWPYRDYVIRAFNQDKPYGRFVQEQIAGDVLFPSTRDGVEAMGFVAAGPWDFIGHAEVPESKIDGRVARHLDRDDMVVNTIETFNSLTIQCAQCHNHKFDPISQEDYYALQADFAALDRADKPYDPDPVIAQSRASLQLRRVVLLGRQSLIEEKLHAAAGPALAQLDRRIASAGKSDRHSEAFGYHSGIESRQETAKWVQVDLGLAEPLRNVILHPCKDDFNNIGEGFGFPVRYRVEASNDPAFKDQVEMIADQTKADVPNPGLKPAIFDATGRTDRYIRVTATKLAPRMEDFILALAELEVFTPDGTNAARHANVTALDSTEAPIRWRKTNLTDGYYPGGGASEAGDLARWRKERADLLAKSSSPEQARELAEIETGLQEIKTDESRLPPLHTVYVACVYKGSGAFSGTGANGGKPRPIRILPRGDVRRPGREVGPGALSAVRVLPARFDLPAEGAEGDRRAALARWLSDPRQPLTWRSIVNRVWQYHFGRGLVETANDFGRNGALPTHPELLDWLALGFRDGGQSFKQLHRLIVTSATYRQSSADNPADAKLDSDNRFLWRMTRRKLEAEELRDSVLSVSGQMDLTMGGPSFQDFVVEKPEHSPHYEYVLHNPDDPKSHRRSIYRFLVRSQPEPLMAALDCADPSMQVAKRNEGLSPLQSLAMLNDPFMVAMSRDFAQKLEREGGSLPAQVERAYYQAMGHPPSMKDRDALAGYAKEFGLPNFCRLLINLNEFVFVD